MLLDTLRSLKSYRPGIAYILSNTLYLAPTACSPAARPTRLCRKPALCGWLNQRMCRGLAEAWGILRHDLALRAASGAPADRRLCAAVCSTQDHALVPRPLLRGRAEHRSKLTRASAGALTYVPEARAACPRWSSHGTLRYAKGAVSSYRGTTGVATLEPSRFSSRSAAPLPASRASQQAATTEDTGFQPLAPGEAEPTAEELAALVEEFFSACGDSGGSGGAVVPLQQVACL